MPREFHHFGGGYGRAFHCYNQAECWRRLGQSLTTPLVCIPWSQAILNNGRDPAKCPWQKEKTFIEGMVWERGNYVLYYKYQPWGYVSRKHISLVSHRNRSLSYLSPIRFSIKRTVILILWLSFVQHLSLWNKRKTFLKTISWHLRVFFSQMALGLALQLQPLLCKQDSLRLKRQNLPMLPTTALTPRHYSQLLPSYMCSSPTLYSYVYKYPWVQFYLGMW